MKTLHYIPILIILFLSACTSDETLTPPEPDGQGNVTFLFTTGSEITTRTLKLNSSQELAACGERFISIYSKASEMPATCEQVKELPWPKPGDVNYATTTRTYSILLPSGDYTFLAIGLDDKSGTTYDLPAAIAVGSTLADAKAVLAAGQTKKDIAQSELFAGSAEAIGVTESGNAAVTINLWRRVAGMLGYFKNAPSGTSKIQITLYTQQNGSGYLLKQEVENEEYPFGIKNPKNFIDYITSPVSPNNEDKTVVSIAVPAGTDAATILSGGSYLLPIAAPPIVDGETEYTLLVELVGADGITVNKTIKVKMKEGDDLYNDPTGAGSGIIDISGPFRYPIVANRLYTIGTALAPVDLGDDGSSDIVITVNPDWDWKDNIEWQ